MNPGQVVTENSVGAEKDGGDGENILFPDDSTIDVRQDLFQGGAPTTLSSPSPQ